MPAPAANLAVGSTIGFNGRRYLVTAPEDFLDSGIGDPVLVEICTPTQPGVYHPAQGNGTYALLLTQNQEWFVLDSQCAPLSAPAKKLSLEEVAAIPDITAIMYFKDNA